MWAFHWMECPGAGTLQCARRDGRQRRLIDFSFYAPYGRWSADVVSAKLCFIRGGLIGHAARLSF